MICKKCGCENDGNSNTCTKCGNMLKTKPLYKKWWFWVIIALGLIIVSSIYGSNNSSDDSQSGNAGNPQISSSDESGDTSSGAEDDYQLTASEEKEKIVYEQVELDTLINDLKSNALKAEKTYQDKYIETTGKISNFDSDGDYISLDPVNGDINFVSVMCYINNDEQLDFLLEKSRGDTVTVKGQITSIGEVMGYSIRIIEIS